MAYAKVTTDDLRALREGETMVFKVADADAINCGKALAYRVQHSLHCKFTVVSDYANNRITITKIPKA